MTSKLTTKRASRKIQRTLTKAQPLPGKKVARKATSKAKVADDFRAPEVRPGRRGATYEDNQKNYAHVRECAERIAQKLEAEDTPELVRRVLEAYLSDLGAQWFKYPSVVRAAYEAVCLVVSHPPFPLRVETRDYYGRVEKLLSRDPERSLAEARRLQRHGLLKGR